jgi:hypothetical protein
MRYRIVLRASVPIITEIEAFDLRVTHPRKLVHWWQDGPKSEVQFNYPILTIRDDHDRHVYDGD